MQDTEQNNSNNRNDLSHLIEERHLKDDIIESIHDGLVVFNPDFSIQVINSQARTLLDFFNDSDHFFEDLNLFKNKKATLNFKLKDWLQQISRRIAKHPKEFFVWQRVDFEHPLKPLLLSAKPIVDDNQHITSILLMIYDRRLQAEADEKKRILSAALNSFDGQFITNDKGYITQPNMAFSAYTGLMQEELSTMSILAWMQKQLISKTSEEQILRALLEDGRWSGEVEVHPNEDTTFYAVLSLSMITDSHRNIECYVGTLQDITDIKQAQAEVEYLAFYDELTGLANRRLLLEHLEHNLLHHMRQRTFSALMFLDLDRFKNTNDTFGHTAGDELLKTTAHRLKEHLRAEDTISRLGGDEFVILTHMDAPSLEVATQHALTLSNKIMDALCEDYHIMDQTLKNSVSIGVCCFPLYQHETPEELIGFADMAMYESKKLGRNRVHFYDQTLSESIQNRHALERSLNSAVIEEEFEMFFQPQFNLNEELVSAEALVRWKHPTLGLVPPSEFIPIAEDGRQILKIGQFVIRESFLKAKDWNERFGLMNLSINISPIQFHETSFVASLRKMQEETGVSPELITLEITEGILISEMELALRKMAALVEMGYKFSIDDFGTGYSSLSYFQKLPIQEIKIDQSFVFRIPDSEEDIAIIDTILNLAKSKQLQIVAEGVETPEQVEFFKNTHESHHSKLLIQGFHFSKPLESDAFEERFFKA
ncbi:putative bifunctional diguanylate cyclase/phosphodiesterase [Hydrogenovibrio kuenenii]|uniref:putative bifunctional diguanylate cyclase/phosphodiesterase n=1 Tax=Hydrogenovibrio kuenenii TaxID=63658 RepID=UPI0004654319|nr:EAL domain-containing protein [Hydrogenovibrio kuenenii]